ncbi:MAG: hypothetical protein WBL72_01255 [Thermoguttaceae bacterium]
MRTKRSPGRRSSLDYDLDYKRTNLMAAHLVWKPSKRKDAPVARSVIPSTIAAAHFQL